MKLKLGLGLGLAAIFILLLATTVMAQGEPPAPYAGMKNPFPWTDNAAQAAGQSSYRPLCLGCHGVDGGNLAQADFTKMEFSQALQVRPDYYFWIMSEGQGGMPAFKSSLSEQQRWQVITYLSSLKAAAPSTPSSPTEVAGVKGSLRLTAPEQAEAGQPVTLTATFEDEQGNPVAKVPVKFFFIGKLFGSGPAEIGPSVPMSTDVNGEAVLEYTPHQGGQTVFVAQYGTNEDRATVNVNPGVETSYQAEAGLQFQAVGGINGIIYPKSVLDLGETSNAPMPAFRWPGGILSWLFILVATVFMIWFTYFRVMYQVFRIPIASEIRDINTRLMPIIGMVIVTTIGLVLILKLLISPYTHLNILLR
ncbi:MAG: c-type cytochrome [Dehalococcoidales bacterium]|nr:c-type cytochrome [Dehalococcoidales bacterium]